MGNDESRGGAGGPRTAGVFTAPAAAESWLNHPGAGLQLLKARSAGDAVWLLAARAPRDEARQGARASIEGLRPPKAAERGDERPELMKYRPLLTASARIVLTLAYAEAATLGQRTAGPEHLLLALLQDEAMMKPLLERSGVNRETLASWLIERMETGDYVGGAIEVILDERAKRVMDFAWAESRRLGRPLVRTRDLLVGVFHEGDGAAWSALTEFVDRDAILRSTNDAE